MVLAQKPVKQNSTWENILNLIKSTIRKVKETVNTIIEKNGEAIPAISARIAVDSPTETEGSCKGDRSYPETRDKDKKGFLEFLPDPSISIRAPSRDSLSQELLRSVAPDVIQIRLILVIFQSFIRRCRSAGGGRGRGRWEDVAPRVKYSPILYSAVGEGVLGN